MAPGGEDRGGAGDATPQLVLVSLLAMGTIAAQFLLRALDDSRFTSWRWAFAEVAPARLYALAAAAIVLAHLAARLDLPGRRPAAVLFVSSCAVAVCFWGEPEAIVDAARYFTQAKQLEVHGLGYFLREWGREIQAWTDLPLVPLLYGLVFDVLGESRTAIQAFTTLLFAASVALTQRIGRALWNDEVGFQAGALLLAMPSLLTQVPGMLVDVPTMFFLTLAVFAAIRAFETGTPGRILLASLAVSLALLSKYSAWLLLSVVPAIGVFQRRSVPRPLRTAALLAVIPVALLGAAGLARPRVLAEQLALLLGYQVPGLGRWGESLASILLFQIHPFVTAAALLSAGLALRRRDPRYAIAAWPVLLLLVLGVRRTRYLIPTFPMLALMAAYGLQAIRVREVRRLVLTCAVATSLVVAYCGHLPFLRSLSAMNLLRAGEYLDSIDEEVAEVITLPGASPEVGPAVSVPLLDLFTRKALVHRGELAPASPPAGMETSPLRFTWEYRSPGYYAPAGHLGAAAVVVICSDLVEPLPERVAARLEGLRLAREFATDEGVFRHRTLVRVYRPGGP